ncbi:MAG: hypothetical protein NVSMB56_15430 [Pyrinomonadaceae bacterium]
MITGFNTDIEHAGVVYHIQTEDKGLNSPLILSLVYIGGTIIASKRSPYEDLIAAGYDENVLTDRLQRQHKLICAAIKAGRIEDLKRLNQRDTNSTPPAKLVPLVADIGNQEAQGSEFDTSLDDQTSDTLSDESRIPTASLEEPKPPPEVVAARTSVSLMSLLDELKSLDRKSPLAAPPMPSVRGADDDKKSKFISVETEQDGLILTLRHESELRAGMDATLQLFVSRGDEEMRFPIANALVVVKILGTTFRPVILKTETEADGTVIMKIKIPAFTSGRAALLIESMVDGDEVSLRRIIRA